MMTPIRFRFLTLMILGASILVACDKYDAEKSPPQITAQGFLIEEVQAGTAGQFDRLRLRIESMARIENLLVEERSYQVDLATTPDINHLALFGLKKRPFLYTDITLDFQNFINEKLVQAGDYEITIEVVDKKNQVTHARLRLRVEEPAGKTAPIETGHFQLQREGKGMVSGSDKFGITWKTIDEINVTIRIGKTDTGASKLARFNAEDYENLMTKEALSQKIIHTRGAERIEFDTANNAAANEVIGVVNQGKHYLLKTNLSNTLLSHIGTTVTLNGEYKY